MSKEALMEEIKSKCISCTSCSLHKTKTNTVFGVGNPYSKIMFIGEAPGENEDLTGVPFVGLSGKLLDKYLAVIGLTRNDIYIANILKCRPPHNRDPLPEEEDMCIGYLREQLKIIDPKIIVCLGRIAAMKVIKPDFRITKEHGKWFKKGKFCICAVYHPSALLRDPAKKEEMLLDFFEIEKMYNQLCQ